MMNYWLRYQEETKKLIIGTTGGLVMCELLYVGILGKQALVDLLVWYNTGLMSISQKYCSKPTQDSTCQISDTVETVTSLSQSKHYLIKVITWKYQSSRSLQAEEVKFCH